MVDFWRKRASGKRAPTLRSQREEEAVENLVKGGGKRAEIDEAVARQIAVVSFPHSGRPRSAQRKFAETTRENFGKFPPFLWG